MGGVIVVDGQLGFTARYSLEWSILSRGAAGAREHIANLVGTVKDEGLKSLLAEMNRTPALVPTDREEIYGRAYALVREAGQGVREELLRIGYSLDETDILDAAFVQGFLDTGCGRDDAQEDYIGAARLCYACGALVANIVESIFPEDAGEAPPDFDEILLAFRMGLTDGVEEG